MKVLSHGRDCLAVGGTVGMTKDQTCRNPAFDTESAIVLRAMMRGAKNHEVVRIVIASVGARLQVVKIHEIAWRQPGTTQRA